MNAYLLSVVGTVLISAILTAIVPEGKTSDIIKNIARLACLLIIISPIPKYLNGGEWSIGEDNDFFSENVIQADETFIKYYSEMRIRNTENTLEKELAEKFSAETEVYLVCGERNEETTEVQIKEIRVTVKNEISEEAKLSMWEYLTKNYCSEVLIE